MEKNGQLQEKNIFVLFNFPAVCLRHLIYSSLIEKISWYLCLEENISFILFNMLLFGKLFYRAFIYALQIILYRMYSQLILQLINN